MQGAIAAGNRVTAEAGARVLAAGGNAIDACIVAAFAAAVTEGPLTGPTGGGFLLAWVDGETTMLDCFFAAPARPFGEIEEIVVDFGDSTQSYQVGDGSVAVPGLVAGLEEAHRRFASMPWPQLVEPAIELARQGLDATEAQSFLHLILEGILQRDEGGRRIYGVPDRIETADFVPTLERIRDVGSQAIVELIPELADDIAAYHVATPKPIRTWVGELEVLTTPAPSRGGAVVAAALEQLATAETLDERARALRHGYDAAPPLAVAGTTHISVIDADGNAAAFSSTLGSGSGVFRGGTQLNNMLGELDIIGHVPGAPGNEAAEHDDADARARERPPAPRSRQRRLRSPRRRDRAGRRRRPPRHVDRGGDRPAADPRRRRGPPSRGWPDGARSRRLADGALGRPQPLLRRRRRGRAQADGSLAAAGDPRRGGHGIVVG